MSYKSLMFASLFKVFPFLFYISVICFAMPSSSNSYIFSSAVPNPWLFPSGYRGEIAKTQNVRQLGGFGNYRGPVWSCHAQLQLSPWRKEGLFFGPLHGSLAGTWVRLQPCPIRCEISPPEGQILFSFTVQRSSHLPISLGGSLPLLSNWKDLQIHTMLQLAAHQFPVSSIAAKHDYCEWWRNLSYVRGESEMSLAKSIVLVSLGFEWN